MIWHICYVSLTHLFEIQLFSSHINHPISHQHTYVSWTDDTHDRLVIQPNITNIYIDRCYSKVEYLIGTCSLLKRNFNQLYQCHPVQEYYLQKRLKRDVADKSKRSLYGFLIFVIGIPCFVIGIIVGIAIISYISIKRQQRREQQTQRYNINKRFDPVIKPLTINNETSKRLYVFL
jgi:hypothetical protein